MNYLAADSPVQSRELELSALIAAVYFGFEREFRAEEVYEGRVGLRDHDGDQAELYAIDDEAAMQVIAKLAPEEWTLKSYRGNIQFLAKLGGEYHNAVENTVPMAICVVARNYFETKQAVKA